MRSVRWVGTRLLTGLAGLTDGPSELVAQTLEEAHCFVWGVVNNVLSVFFSVFFSVCGVGLTATHMFVSVFLSVFLSVCDFVNENA